MLLIVNADNQILARFEAWSTTCTEDAAKWAQENGMEIVRTEVTFSGNLVYWVEKIA